MSNTLPSLCGQNGCRRIADHSGQHDTYPTEAWDFFGEKDKKKLVKAGFATPRGGAKGAYQNHVARNSKVIIPFERVSDVELALYKDDFVIRLLPEQYFSAPNTPKPEFLAPGCTILVGTNAFVLYRTHDSLTQYPPMAGWSIRGLIKNGQAVTRRGNGAVDVGHYVLRVPRHGARPKRVEGPPQGVFAPEYADENTNYLSKCVLAWLIIQAKGSPYTMSQAGHLKAILASEELDSIDVYERSGALRRGLTSCPLCMRFLKYNEFHETVSFADGSGLTNASEQVEGATRSTVVNLFHLMPLLYHELTHVPTNIGWGHAICNTRLGQRPCYSLHQLMDTDLKVGVVREEGIVDTFGWISEDWLMIRSPNGAVWMQLNGDEAEGPPEEAVVFDKAAEPEPEAESDGTPETDVGETPST